MCDMKCQYDKERTSKRRGEWEGGDDSDKAESISSGIAININCVSDLLCAPLNHFVMHCIFAEFPYKSIDIRSGDLLHEFILYIDAVCIVLTLMSHTRTQTHIVTLVANSFPVTYTIRTQHNKQIPSKIYCVHISNKTWYQWCAITYYIWLCE